MMDMGKETIKRKGCKLLPDAFQAVGIRKCNDGNKSKIIVILNNDIINHELGVHCYIIENFFAHNERDVQI
jgi:hypothetical protein